MQREHLDARSARRNEDGFTLLELMMVILIIAILIAVLMPVFAGAATRAKDRAVQSSLRNAVTAAKTVFADKADYMQATAATLAAQTGALVFVNAGTAPIGPNTISVAPVSATYIVFGGLSKSGDCFYASDDASGAGTLYAKSAGSGGCAATGAPLPGDAAWQKAW